MGTATDTTVSIKRPDGTMTDPVDVNDISGLADSLRESGHDLFAEKQLSFDVGLPGDNPEFGSVKIGGSFGVSKDLAYGREARIIVMALNGEVLVDTQVKVTGIAFKKDAHNFTERIHTLG